MRRLVAKIRRHMTIKDIYKEKETEDKTEKTDSDRETE